MKNGAIAWEARVWPNVIYFAYNFGMELKKMVRRFQCYL